MTITRIDVALDGGGAAPTPWIAVFRAGAIELHRGEVAFDPTAPAITAAVDALRGATLDERGACALGAALYDALLTPAWSAITAHLAAAAPTAIASPTSPAAPTLVELALDLDAPAAAPLRALPWELMRAPDGWLACGARADTTRVDVVITRRTARASATAPPLTQPLRYLFVIGTQLDDTVRAGAECLGLLRQIAPVVQERIVQRQSLDELRAVIASFAPHVVHVICHGREVESGPVQLQLWDAGRGEPAYVGADQLADAIVQVGAAGRQAPTIVVLSACASGDRLAAAGSGDLARALVAAGVPMVIGMAAEIRDQVCRLFAGGIGRAFVDRTPILAAAAHGRRAALSGSTAAGTTDWGLVQILIGRDVDAALAVAPAAADDDEQRVLAWLEGAALPLDVRGPDRTVPPLCDGDRLVDELYRLMGTTHAALLVRARPPRDGVRVGASRAFAELAAAAIRAGHLPIIVMPARARGLPRTAAQVVAAIRDAIEAAWIRHGLDLAAAPGAMAALAAQPEAALTASAVLTALDRDARALRGAAHADPFIARADGRPLLMLHDVHHWGDGTRLVFELLTARGARLRAIAPTVIGWTMLPPDAHDGGRRVLDDDLRATLVQAQAWVRTLDLLPLAPIDNERDDLGLAAIPPPAKLAIQRVLLHPFRARPPYATRRYFLELRADDVALSSALGPLVLGTDGCCLGQFSATQYIYSLKALIDGGVVRAADDDDVLRAGGTAS